MSSYITSPGVFLPLMVLLFFGCTGPNTYPDSETLARVGDHILTVDAAREQIPDFILQEDSISAYRNITEEWVRKQVILQEARRLQLHRDREVQKRLQRLEEEILTQALKEYVLGNYEGEVTVTDEEARNYYQANKNQFVLNERFVRFRHMVTNSIESARGAKRDLMRGIEWPEVAREYAVNPEAQIQQSEKFWPISMALNEIGIMNRMLQRIGITEISPIHRVGSQYHFVQLVETRAEGDHPDLDWLIDQIKEWLILEKRRRHFNSYVKNLYLKAQSNNEIDTYNVYNSNSN